MNAKKKYFGFFGKIHGYEIFLSLKKRIAKEF